MSDEVGRAIVRSVYRRRNEFIMQRGSRPPAYLLLDAATYRVLRAYCRAGCFGPSGARDLARFMDMTIVVVPVPEMLAVVAEPYLEIDPPRRRTYDLNAETLLP